MYKITFEDTVKKIIEKENINKIELISSMQEDIQSREMNEIDDIIFTLNFKGKKVALIGTVGERNVNISHMSTNPIIVEKR